MPPEHFLTKRARALRRSTTTAESALWSLLRGRRIGVKFRRQQPLGPYVLDFFSVEARLVIEVDGPSHTGCLNRDRRRDQWLSERGLSVLRLTNEDVLKRPELALQRIAERLTKDE